MARALGRTGGQGPTVRRRTPQQLLLLHCRQPGQWLGVWPAQRHACGRRLASTACKRREALCLGTMAINPSCLLVRAASPRALCSPRSQGGGPASRKDRSSSSSSRRVICSSSRWRPIPRFPASHCTCCWATRTQTQIQIRTLTTAAKATVRHGLGQLYRPLRPASPCTALLLLLPPEEQAHTRFGRLLTRAKRSHSLRAVHTLRGRRVGMGSTRSTRTRGSRPPAKAGGREGARRPPARAGLRSSPQLCSGRLMHIPRHRLDREQWPGQPGL